MRVLVCGGRNYSDEAAIRAELSRFPPGTTIVHGGATGADSLAGIAAAELWLFVEVHPAYWDKYGRRAGPIRNQEMLDSGIDLVIAFPGGRGTADMVHRARKAGVKVKEVVTKL
jgi:hypothetical protein